MFGLGSMVTGLLSDTNTTNSLVSGDTGLASGLLGTVGLGGIGATIDKIFGRRDYSFFAGQGKIRIDKAISNFKSAYPSNPSFALTNLSKTLYQTEAEFQYALNKSSSTRTKKGNAESLKVIKSAISTFPQFLTEVKKKFTVNSQRLEEVNRYYKYFYNKYVLSAKTEVKKSDFVNTSNTENKSFSKQPETALYLIVAGLIYVFRDKLKRLF